MVEISAVSSNTEVQKRGIRQGCPLSPYLFVLVMTAPMHDVHFEEEKREYFPNGMDFGEVLYADDTILIWKKLQRTRKHIEQD